MDGSSVAKNTVTLTAASNSLENFGIKVSVSTLRQDSQRPADVPLPTLGPSSFFSEEVEINIYNAVGSM